MTYKTEKEMVFKFLQHRNWNQPWEDLEIEIGYDLGDWHFTNKEIYSLIQNLAKIMWSQLHTFKFD